MPLSGASDHLVSEAIYLDDPEGNGIEVYRDRKPEEWRWNGDRIQMATDRLDLDNLAAEAGNTAYAGAPEGLRIGHIHLRVGDLGATQQFYSRRDRPRSDRRARRRAVHVIRAATTITSAATPGTRPAPDSATMIAPGSSWFAIEAADAADRDAARGAAARGAECRCSGEHECMSKRAIRLEPGCAFTQ